jgi:hypothetical protein
MMMDTGRKSADLNEFLKKETGRTLFQLEKMAQGIMALGDEDEVAKFMNYSKRADFWDHLLYYRDASLLSGPITHMHYVEGGMLNLAVRPLPTLLASVGGTVKPGEAFAMYASLPLGASRGLKAAVATLRYGDEGGMAMLARETAIKEGAADIKARTEDLRQNPTQGMVDQALLQRMVGNRMFSDRPSKIFSTKPGISQVMTAASMVMRSVKAVHAMQESLNMQMSLASISYKAALKEGLSPGTDTFNNRVSDMINNPTSEMLTQSNEDAHTETYTGGIGRDSMMAKLADGVSSTVAGRLLFPFAKMQIAIKSQALLKNSPLGAALSKEVRSNLASPDRNIRDLQYAKLAIGTGIAGAAFAFQKNITGNGPVDPKEHAIWRTYNTPNTLSIGSMKYSLSQMGNVGQVLQAFAELRDASTEIPEHKMDQAVGILCEHLSRIALSGSFLQNLQNTLDAASNPTEHLDKFIQNFATQFYPAGSLVNQANSQIDPYRRSLGQPHMSNFYNIVNAAKRITPGLSEELAPQRDMFGQPIKRDGSNTEAYANDPVVQRLSALGIGVNPPEKAINGVQLSDQQYDDYARIAGITKKQILDNTITTPEFSNMPPQLQIKMIDRIGKGATQQARTAVLTKSFGSKDPNYPDITAASNLAKMKAAGLVAQ